MLTLNSHVLISSSFKSCAWKSSATVHDFVECQGDGPRKRGDEKEEERKNEGHGGRERERGIWKMLTKGIASKGLIRDY